MRQILKGISSTVFVASLTLALGQYIAIADDAETHYERARAFSVKGEFDKALAEAKQAANLHPKEPAYLSYLGRQYCAAGEPEQALASYEQALHVSERPLMSWPDKAEAVLWIEQLKELTKLSGSSSNRKTLSIAKDFEGAWAQRLAGVGELTTPAHDAKELAQIRTQFEQQVGQEIDTLHIKQYGGLLHAVDLKAEYVGCSSGPWFVIGTRREGVSNGCKSEQHYLITGQLIDTSNMKGTIIAIGDANKHTKACQAAIGRTELLFTASKR